MTDWTQIPTLLACPACKFDPNAPVTVAASSAIGFMVVVVAVVLSAFIALICRFALGERRVQREAIQQS